MDKRFSAFHYSCRALSKEVQKSWKFKTFYQGYGMTILNYDVLNWNFFVNFIVKNMMDICPLFTCQVSQQDIYYIWNYTKIWDILMTDLRGGLAPARFN